MTDAFKQGVANQSQDKEVKRSEIVPGFVKTLHKIPKQLVDTSQMVGVSEQLMSLRLNSGVILASQTAHDKWLARLDGAVDSFWIFIVVILFSLTGPNYLVVAMIVAGLWYWYIHLEWYSQSKQWETSITGTEYLIKTVQKFWNSFFVTSFLLYFLAANIVINKMAFFIQKIIAYLLHFSEKAISGIISLINYISDSEGFGSYGKSKELTTEELKDLIQSGRETVADMPSYVDKMPIEGINFDSIIDVTKIEIDSWWLTKEQVFIILDKYSIMPNIHFFSTYENGRAYILLMSVFFVMVFTFMAKKKFDIYYSSKKDEIKKDIEYRLNYDADNFIAEMHNKLNGIAEKRGF